MKGPNIDTSIEQPFAKALFHKFPRTRDEWTRRLNSTGKNESKNSTIGFISRASFLERVKKKKAHPQIYQRFVVQVNSSSPWILSVQLSERSEIRRILRGQGRSQAPLSFTQDQITPRYTRDALIEDKRNASDFTLLFLVFLFIPEPAWSGERA